MNGIEFSSYRKSLNKTQKEMARLLGGSIKAVHSYEQGWRSIPAHVERQVLFLIASKSAVKHPLKPCWKIKKCPPEHRKRCPAWEYQAGHLCWFINGTVCEGAVETNWNKKMEKCRECIVLRPLLHLEDI